MEAETQRRRDAAQPAAAIIEATWKNSKRRLAEAQVAEGASVPFEQRLSVRRGEILLLTVLPNGNHGADSTLVEWSIREAGGDQRAWSVTDVAADLLKGNSWPAANGAAWSFLETTAAFSQFGLGPFPGGAA